MPRNERIRRGNWENDLLALLFFCARAKGKWLTLRKLEGGTGIPRVTLNYLFWFEGKGIVVRKRTKPDGQSHLQAQESVMDRIAAKYGIKYVIRRVHAYKNKRVPCECGNPTDEWEISAVFVEPPQDQDWNRFVERTIDGTIADPDGGPDQGFDGESV